jgi:hypothetical protein
MVPRFIAMYMFLYTVLRSIEIQFSMACAETVLLREGRRPVPGRRRAEQYRGRRPVTTTLLCD